MLSLYHQSINCLNEVEPITGCALKICDHTQTHPWYKHGNSHVEANSLTQKLIQKSVTWLQRYYAIISVAVFWGNPVVYAWSTWNSIYFSELYHLNSQLVCVAFLTVKYTPIIITATVLYSQNKNSESSGGKLKDIACQSNKAFVNCNIKKNLKIVDNQLEIQNYFEWNTRIGSLMWNSSLETYFFVLSLITK